MSSVKASPVTMNTINGPMKRGASLPAPRLVTFVSRRLSVDINTRSPFLKLLVIILPCLSAFSFCFFYCRLKCNAHKSGDGLTLEYKILTQSCRQLVAPIQSARSEQYEIANSKIGQLVSA